MNNICRISSALAGAGLDAVLLTSEENRYYATGFDATEGYLMITGEGAAFFLDARYAEQASEYVQGAEVVLVEKASEVHSVMNDYMAKHKVKYLGVESGRLPYASYERLKNSLTAEFQSAQKMLADLRKVKSAEELDIMKKAQKISEKAFEETVAVMTPDMTEKELAAELFCRMIKNGADDRSFDTIVVSGTHSSMPHGKAEDRPLQKGFLTVDFGCKYMGYCSDTTRTLCIGEPTAEMEKVYNTVLKAQQTAISAARAGIAAKDLDAAARDVIKAAGYGEYFTHSLSHGVGIEIHESPTASPLSQDVLEAGNVISVEPGIYIPGNYGVRIEDVICIKECNAENLTSLNKELRVIWA